MNEGRNILEHASAFKKWIPQTA